MWLEQSLATLELCTRSPNDSPERRRHRKRNNWSNSRAASPGSEVRLGVKRWIVLFSDRRGQRSQSHVRDGISRSEKCCCWHVFVFSSPMHMRIIGGKKTLRLLFVLTFFPFFLYKLFGGRSSRLRWLGKALKLKPNWGESGRPDLSVGKCIHVDYLLLVRQEMGNDNKLGKEKQGKQTNCISTTDSFFFF